ncbi:putative transposase [Yersinia enterocolitica]|nr:putative transposase [Yersinia enterocolitica]
MLHTGRNILIRERTACANSMRAILAEFGIIMPRTSSQLYKKIPEILEEYDNELSPFVRCSVARQLEHLQGVEDQITLIEQNLAVGQNTTRLPAGHESPRSGIDDGDLPCGVSGEWATISFSETICCLVGIGAERVLKWR